MEAHDQDSGSTVPWGGLPIDILSMIAQRIPSSREYGAMRCVNRHWNSSLESAPLPIHVIPRMPFLVLPPKPSATNPRPEINTVICMRRSNEADQDASHLKLPNITRTGGKITIGSGHGWLILLDENSGITLFNPLTSTSISLPPLSSVDRRYLRFHRNRTPPYKVPGTNKGYTRQTLIHRAVLSSGPDRAVPSPDPDRAVPSSDPDRAVLSSDPEANKDPEKFQVMIYFQDMKSCCFTCTEKSNAWTRHAHRPVDIEDVVFYKEKFWAIDRSWVLTSFKLEEDNTLLVTSKIVNDSIPLLAGYLAISGGDLVLFIKYRRQIPEGVRVSWSRRVKFGLYKLVKGGVVVNEAELITSLPGVALFVGHGCSVSVKTDGLNGLEDNTAYFYDARHIGEDSEFDQRRTMRPYRAKVYTYSVTSGIYSVHISIHSVVEAVFPCKDLQADAQTFWVAPNFPPRPEIMCIEPAAMPISLRTVFKMLSSSRFTKFVFTAVVGVVAFIVMDQWQKKRV